HKQEPPERQRDPGSDERHGEERGDATHDDAGETERAPYEPDDPAVAEVGEDEQDQERVEDTRERHPRSFLRSPSEFILPEGTFTGLRQTEHMDIPTI